MAPSVTYLKIRRNGHIDGLPGRRHPVQQQRVVKGRVPRGLEPEMGSFVTSGVEIFARKEAEGEYASVQVVVDVRLRRDALRDDRG